MNNAQPPNKPNYASYKRQKRKHNFVLSDDCVAVNDYKNKKKADLFIK